MDLTYFRQMALHGPTPAFAFRSSNRRSLVRSCSATKTRTRTMLKPRLQRRAGNVRLSNRKCWRSTPTMKLTNSTLHFFRIQKIFSANRRMALRRRINFSKLKILLKSTKARPPPRTGSRPRSGPPSRTTLTISTVLIRLILIKLFFIKLVLIRLTLIKLTLIRCNWF